MNFNIENKVGARFKLFTHHGDGVPTKETEWFDNIVLDSGLERMFSGEWIDRCCVGSGNSTPIPEQIALDNFIASTIQSAGDSVAINSYTEPYYSSMSRKWRFNQGIAAGNISEVGMGWRDNALWNRALIRDVNGNPTTITVLSDEYLDVIAEIRFYVEPSISGVFSLIDKYGTLISEHSYVGMPYFDDSLRWATGEINFSRKEVYDGSIRSMINLPSGNQIASIRSSGVTVSQGVQRSTLELGLSLANNINHRSFLLAAETYSSMYRKVAAYQIEISPPIQKTDTQIMTYTFELSWGRYEPV